MLPPLYPTQPLDIHILPYSMTYNSLSLLLVQYLQLNFVKVGERGKLVWLSWLLHLTYLKLETTSAATTNALLGNKTKEKFKFGQLSFNTGHEVVQIKYRNFNDLLSENTSFYFRNYALAKKIAEMM